MARSLEEIAAERLGIAPPQGDRSLEDIADERMAESAGRSLEEIAARRLTEQELADDQADWDLMRENLRYAEDDAYYAEDPVAKHRAGAKALYLRDRTNRSEELGKFLDSGGALPGKMPGEKTSAFKFFDTADAFVSWVSRPTHSALSTHADMDYIWQMNPDDFGRWTEKLHEDDPRKNVYRKIKKNLEERNREDDYFNPKLDAELLLLRGQLAATYWVPNSADPYGGYGGGNVVGGPPATTADIWLRGLAAPASKLWNGIDVGPDGDAASIHTEYQHLGGELLAAGGAAPWADYQRRRVQKAIEEGDPHTGLLLPTLFYAIGPDLLLPGGLITKAGKQVFKTGAGVLTKSGDAALHATVSRHNKNLMESVEKFKASGDDVNVRDVDALSLKLSEGIKNIYAQVGDMAVRGERFHAPAAKAVADDLGEGARAVGESMAEAVIGVGKKPKGVHPIHINVDDAISFKAGEVSFDTTKVRVLYSDDSAVKHLLSTVGRVPGKAGIPASTASRESAGQALEKLIGGKEAKAVFGKEGGFNVPLTAFGVAAMGTAGWASTDEEDPFLKRAGTAALFGALGAIPGAPVGRVVDVSGKAVVGKMLFRPGSVGFGELTNDPGIIGRLGGAAAKAQQSLPFLKGFRPWAVKATHTINGKTVSYWKPLEASDTLGPHSWVRMQHLAKKMGFDRRQMATAVNEAIHETMKGQYRKGNREIIAHFIEALGYPAQHSDDAQSVFKALRHHLNKVMQWKPRSRPEGSVKHMVTDADTAASIAIKYDMTVDELMALNPKRVKKGKKGKKGGSIKLKPGEEIQVRGYRDRGMVDRAGEVLEVRGRMAPQLPSKGVAGAEKALRVEEAVSGVLERSATGWAKTIKGGKKGLTDQPRMSALDIYNKLKERDLAKMFPGVASRNKRLDEIQKTLDELSGAGVVRVEGAGSGRSYVSDPSRWETYVRDVGKTGKPKKRPSKKAFSRLTREASKKATKGQRMPGAGEDFRPEVPVSKKALKDADEAVEDARLKENVHEAFQAELGKARVVSLFLKQMTGHADLDEVITLAKLRKELEVSIAKADDLMSDTDFVTAVKSMTVQDARNAARMVARTEKRFGKGVKVDPRWERLTDQQKLAVGHGRDFFTDMYNLLKAEGLLGKSWSLARFLDKMQVEGYIHHLFTGAGKEKFRELAGQFKTISAEADFVKARGIRGTIEEVNENVRKGIAEMIYKEVNKIGDDAFAKMDEVVRDAELAKIVDGQGLNDIKFFETDAARIMERYGKKVTRSVSNKRFIDNILAMFPEGERLAALASKGGKHSMRAEMEAAQAGFKKVDNLKHLRAVLGEDYWAGWDKYAPQIRNIINTSKGEAVEKNLFEFLKKQGVDLADQRITGQVKGISRDVYLPYAYADYVEALGDTTWLNELAHKSTWVGAGLGTFDAVLSFFKTATTVFAPAFHGRNYISNVITNLMTHGWQAASPRQQIEAFSLMRGDPERTWTLVTKTEGGQTIKTTKRVREWREEMRSQGIISDQINPSDIRGGKYGEDVNWKAPAITAGAGAALGAGIGFAAEPGEDPSGRRLTPAERANRKMVAAFAGAMIGGGVGTVGASAIEMFVKRPAQAAMQEAKHLGGIVGDQPHRMENAKLAFSAGFDEWMNVVGYRPKVGSSVLGQFAGAVGESEAFKIGVVGAIAGGAVGGVTPAEGESAMMSAFNGAVYGMLATGGVKAVGEGAFILAGGVGRKIEEQAKICNYLAGRKIGLSADAAAELTHKTLFNYDDLTTFERHWLRRIFPFYTWTSKNATELQPFLLKERPFQYSALSKLMDAAENSFSRKQDMNMIPDHLQYRVAFSAGLGKIIAGFGLPQEDLIDLFKTAELGQTGKRLVPTGVISRIHPFVPFISKFMFGKDPYYNVDLDRIRSGRDVRYLPEGIRRWAGYAEVPGVYTDEAGVQHDYVKYEVGWMQTARSRGEGVPWEYGTKRQSKHVGSRRLALLRSIPAWRLVSEYNKAITDTFMGGISAEQGEKATAGERALALFSGIKPYSVDWNRMEDYAYRRFEERLDAVLKDMDRKGEIDVYYKQPRRTMRENRALYDLGLIPEED